MIINMLDVSPRFETLADHMFPFRRDGELMKGVNRKVGDGQQPLIGQTWGLSETTGAVTMMPKEASDDTGSISPILPAV